MPLAIVFGLEVDSAQYGKGSITFENRGKWVAAGAARFVGEIGFLSSPETAAEVQRVWDHRQYGSANWRVLVIVRREIDWVSCPPDTPMCREDKIWGDQALIRREIYLHENVWSSILNDYLVGGLSATTKNPHYEAIQKLIFEEYSSITPAIPCIGFKFTKQN